MTLLLRGVTLPDGGRADVRLDGPVIGAVSPPGEPGDPGPDADELDLTGHVLLPAPAEPHAHLDKALLADRSPNVTGDLDGAIEAMRAVAPTLTHDDLVHRATRAALICLGHGATAIRSHADVSPVVGVRHVAALAEVRERLRGTLDLQVVALAFPLTGPDGDHGVALLGEALEAGADVAGGCPHLEQDPELATRRVLEVAGGAGVPVDLHTDENLRTDSLDLPVLAELVLATGFAHPVTASHCVSLGMQAPDVAARVAATVARAGVAVVTLPQTNLFLQGRDSTHAVPRGLTAVRALLDAGAVLAAGGDNVRDPFNSMGRGDPLEAASLLVTAGHLLPHEAWAAVSSGARAALGLPTGGVRPGDPAELLAVRATSLTDAVAAADPERVVVSRGRVVARTRIDRTFPTLPDISGPGTTPSFHGRNTDRKHALRTLSPTDGGTSGRGGG